VRRHAINEPLRGLRNALDCERYTDAIGAAKDLAEAACKVVIEHAGEALPESASFTTLFKQAHRAVAVSADAPDSDLGRSLAATVQRLAELRNIAGAGHGHAAPPALAVGHARMAAAASTGVAQFLLVTERSS
jgi:hypothetical protein